MTNLKKTIDYFANSIDVTAFDDFDKSCTPPVFHLLWRLEDLDNRRSELIASGECFESFTRLNDNDIRYILAEDLDCVGDVERAIELAAQQLKEEYEIDIFGSLEVEENCEFESAMPLLFDIITLPDPNPLKAA